MADCLFCKIASGTIPAKLVAEDEHAVAFNDINPQAPTHVLVVPREHIASLNELRPEHAALVGHLHLLATRVAAEIGIAASGYRTVFNTGRDANQTVHHIHLHLIGGRALGWPPG